MEDRRDPAAVELGRRGGLKDGAVANEAQGHRQKGSPDPLGKIAYCILARTVPAVRATGRNAGSLVCTIAAADRVHVPDPTVIAGLAKMVCKIADRARSDTVMP